MFGVCSAAPIEVWLVVMASESSFEVADERDGFG